MRAIQLVIASLLLTGCFVDALSDVAETKQELTTAVWPPSGWTEGRVYVGQTTGGDVKVAYKTGMSGGGTCVKWETIGTSSTLTNRTHVHTGNLGDEVHVLGAGESRTICGSGTTLIGLGGSPKLEVWGGDGIDIVQSKGLNPNFQAHLDDGDDLAVVGDAWALWGQGGSDFLIGLIPETANMVGEGGNDLCCGYSNAFACDGGSGTGDAQYGGWIVLQNVENMSTLANCNFFRDYVYAEIAD